MTMKSALHILLLSFSLATVQAMHLSIENFLDVTEGKTVMLKLYAPWCQHCEAMSPAWEKLTNEWKDHKVGLVGEIDCDSEEGAPICEEYEITGFPTILYGDPLSPEVYDGELDYDALSAFAKDNISKPVCSVSMIENCDATMTTLIKGLQKKTVEELEQMEEEALKMVEEEQAVFDKKADEIQLQYAALVSDFNAKVEAIRQKTNFKWVQQVLNEMEEDYDDGLEDEF